MTACTQNDFSDFSVSLLSGSSNGVLYQINTADINYVAPTEKKTVRFNEIHEEPINEKTVRETTKPNSFTEDLRLAELFKNPNKELNNQACDDTVNLLHFHDKSLDSEPEYKSNLDTVLVGNSHDLETLSPEEESDVSIPIGDKILNHEFFTSLNDGDNADVDVEQTLPDPIRSKTINDNKASDNINEQSSSRYSTGTDGEASSFCNMPQASFTESIENPYKNDEYDSDVIRSSNLERTSAKTSHFLQPTFQNNVRENSHEVYNHFDSNYMENEALFDESNLKKSNNNASVQSGWDLKRKLSVSFGKRALMEKLSQLKAENEQLAKTTAIQEEIIKNLKTQFAESVEETKNYKNGYKTLKSENNNIIKLFKKSEQQLLNANLKLETLQQINEMEKNKYRAEEMERNKFLSLENETMKSFRATLESTNAKNQYLEEMFRFLTKRVNEIYQFTIAPALYLASVEIQSASDDLIFDSHNSIQTYINSNFTIFKEAYEILKIEKIDSIGQYKKTYERTMKDFDTYFNNLNDLIAEKMEILIRQKMQLE